MKKICKIMLLLIISFLFVFGMVNYTSIISKISSQFNIHSNNYNNGNNSNDRIHFINVNHGSAFLIESNGKFGLIDSGYDENAHHLVNYLNAVLPEGKKLDFVLLTHHHEDHAGGFAKVVNAGFVNQNTIFYYKEYTLTDEDRRYILNGNPTCKDDFDSAYIPLVNAQVQLVNLKGQNEEYELNFGGFNIKFLNISKEWTDLENNNSIVTLVTHVTSNKKVLLTGDIQVPAEKWLIEQVNTGKINLGKVDILKPGHHGISTSSCYEFMDLVQPNEMIIDRVNMAYDTNPTSNAAFRYWSKKYLNKEYDEAPIYIDGYATEDGAIIVTFNSNGYNIADSGRKSLEDLRMKSQIMYDDTFLRITNYTDKGVAKNWWYYFDEFDEKALTGLQKINYRGTQYTFYFKSSGEMATGFNLVDGNWRYFCEISDHIEGYTGGAMITGWHNLKYKGIEYTFYFDEDGVMAEGFKKIDNKWYYFSSSVVSEKITGYTGGAMVTGWHNLKYKEKEYTFYFDEDGVMAEGFKQIDNKWYYFSSSVISEIIEGYTGGAMVTGWHNLKYKEKEYTFYFDEDGVMAEGFKQIDNKWYYFSSSVISEIIEGYTGGAMITGWHNLKYKGIEYTFYFDEDGVMAEGFKKIDNKWYYFSSSVISEIIEGYTGGAMVKGLHQIDNKIYYLADDNDSNGYSIGERYHNICSNINNEYYCFDENGVGDVVTVIEFPTSENYCETLTYTGSEQTLTKTPGSGYIFDGNKGTNAGEYTVTATLESGYRWSDNTTEEKTFKCSIEKATPIITLNPKSVTVVAGGQVTFKEKADVAGSFNNTSGTTNVTTISPATNTNVEANTEITETVSGVSEGSSEISITFTPTDTTNYKNVSKTLIAIVTKNVTIPTSENYCETLIYTGSEQTLTKTPGSGYIFDGNKGTNAGEYTVTATLVSGYRWSDNTTEEKTFKCTIEKAKLSTPQVENYNGEYDGNYHSIMVSPVSIGTIIYSYDNLTWTLNKPMRSDVGTTNVYVKVLGDDNYFDSDTVTSSITITSNFSYLINNYDIDNSNKYISKIVPRTSLETFKNNIELGIGYSVSIDTKNIDEKKLLYTGGKTKIMKDSSVVIEYTNVVIGDINGDAAINSADLLKIRQHLLGTNILTNAYFLSSDINYDNIINSADLLRLRQHLLGTKPIE